MAVSTGERLRRARRHDWTAYLAHADYLEEQGDPGAEKARLRAEIMSAVMRGLRAALADPTGVVDGSLPGGGRYVVRARKRLVFLYVRTGPEGPLTQFNLCRDLVGRPDYVPGRVRELFAPHHYNCEG
jgi:uncharacterized protein (TIGR02996 family)